MLRLLPFGFLFSLPITALAQQPDTLRPRPVAVQVPAVDSLEQAYFSGSATVMNRLSCIGVGIPIRAASSLLTILPLQDQLRQVAGVQATPYSGAPGAQVAVRIRGAASLSGNAQPLYVVDGIPVFQHTFRQPQTDNSGFRFEPAETQELDQNPLLSIPTQDIESVEVLKGAYETAQYGSQGLNGVIRITTRRGQTGKPSLSYTAHAGLQRVGRRYELLDARQYAELRNDMQANAGRAPEFSAAELAALGRGTDWQSEVLRTAAVQEHHLGLRGGTAATRYYVGADYRGQQGVVINSRLRRYALRAALDQRVGERLQLAVTGGFSQTEQRLSRYPFEAALLALPTTLPDTPPTDAFINNPVRELNDNYQTPQQRRLLGQAEARYALPAGFMLHLRGGFEQATLKSQAYRTLFSQTVYTKNTNLNNTYRQWVLNPAVRYAGSFGAERHVVAASLEGQLQRRQETGEFEEAAYFNGSPATFSRATFETTSTFPALQLTADYTFAGRYQLRGTLRRDAGSTFATADEQQLLPGAQVVWHASEESFWNLNGTQLKAWAGWGRTSGMGMAGRNYIGLMLPTGGNMTQRVPAFLPDRTQQLDAGLEAGFFNDKLTTTLQAYSRDTRQQLVLLGPAGDEFGRIRNAGLELTLGSHWQAGRLRGNSGLAAAVNRNRFTSEGPLLLGTSYQQLRDGQPLSTFFGPRYLGVNPANGRPLLADTNGDGQVNYDDNVPLGSGLPQQLLSFQQRLALGRCELQLQADGMFGYQVQNTALQYLDSPSPFPTNASTRVLDRWTPANPRGSTPGAGYEPPFFSSYTLQSGNHVRLSAVSFSVKVWEKAQRNIHIWTAGQNLLVLSRYRGFDPNVSSAGSDNRQAGIDASTYPIARTLLLGVRATL
ncbi:SusC/RagA family TonB-linked outer membrane protein [Hymenobacter terrestris]|uniref:SusC/RagA family TonB-linked outer membrane protein n=1 Tax=Hymenobacter terrestris TaxID=2748310 RepID=A0ABX2Q3Q0_9BACT|nr:SusC/RagA family TonB-linked outer membrane protein [Hymenobacter terrestris]NVO85598.1 SusC/RagA family TonB-linked outer membrane protein [Hymenobacter terrestris]